MTTFPVGDKKQIGLTPVGQAAIEILMQDDRFDTESDAYRFGISYALAAGFAPDDAPPGGYSTKFSASGGLDIDGVIRDLLVVLAVGDVARPYATAERLAELGVTTIAKRLEGHESLSEIMANPTAEVDAAASENLTESTM
jgi:hypothetical protein